MRTTRRGTPIALLLATVLWVPALAAAQSMAEDAYVLPPESVQELFRRDKTIPTLDQLSPDGDHFLVPRFQELTTLELMSQRTLRLAMLEFVPAVNREWRLATYGNTGLDIFSLKERRTYSVQLPEGAFFSDMRWSPDGSKLAFVAHLPTASEVWVADVATGHAEAVSHDAVMATLMGRPGRGDASEGRLLQWLPDGSLLTVLVPANRGPEPPEPKVPTSPIIRTTRDKKTPTPTYPFPLRTHHDEELFKYYTTAQLAIVSPGKPAQPVGEPAMYSDVWVSPDGKYILRERLEEPFSYMVGFSGFGTRLEVMDLSGKVLAEVRHKPLQEGRSRDGNGGDLPREVGWRPDGKGLSLVWREKADEASGEPAHDRLMLLAPPFDMARVQTIVSTEHEMSAPRYSKDGHYVFATLARDGGRRDIVAYDLSGSEPVASVLKGNIDPDDPLKLPGEIMTKTLANGTPYALVSTDGASAFLQGEGYKATFTPQPFVDRVAIKTGAATRLFEGATTTYDKPLVPLDADVTRMIVSREGKNTVPDSYLWTGSTTALENLTKNVDPYPEITKAQRVDFDFVRRDGVKVQGRISLPTNYTPGTRVPAVFWTYPREFDDEADYDRGAIRARNHNAFTPLSFLRWSDIWLTQGYALVYPDIPILGEDNRFNDHFRSNLSDTMYAAIRKLDEMGYIDPNRLGHGGHSYGAFTTANLLAHTPYFKAGIAGDGAYNRTLTPMQFQGERRNIWDAPTTYLEISPFFYADEINSPLLMYHGASDNNTGTFIIQSERMLQALAGLGKTAALYIYPYESHAPRARENFLDLWARWLGWFDKYVKNAPDTTSTSTAPRLMR